MGYSLLEVLNKKDEKLLEKTFYSQPAIFAHSLICFKNLIKIIKPDYLSGHSLGEFSAVVASTALSLSDGFKLIGKRAEVMDSITKENSGGMMAVLGLKDEVVMKLLEDYPVYAANFNCDGQIVLSGKNEDLIEFEEVLRENKAKRVLHLKVSGAFHSAYVKKASDLFKEYLTSFTFKDAKNPLILSYDLNINKDALKIKKNLLEQMINPVKWRHIVENLSNEGVDIFIEVGPGKVLKGLVRRILPSSKIFSVSTEKDIKYLKEIF